MKRVAVVALVLSLGGLGCHKDASDPTGMWRWNESRGGPGGFRGRQGGDPAAAAAPAADPGAQAQAPPAAGDAAPADNGNGGGRRGRNRGQGGQFGQRGGRGGFGRSYTIKLKLDGSALSGEMRNAGRGEDINYTPLDDVSYNNGEISFTIKREFNGQVVSQEKYTGTMVDADTIQGKVESERDGKTDTQDWEAKRVKLP
jgi:hypothetical protein